MTGDPSDRWERDEATWDDREAWLEARREDAHAGMLDRRSRIAEQALGLPMPDPTPPPALQAEHAETDRHGENDREDEPYPAAPVYRVSSDTRMTIAIYRRLAGTNRGITHAEFRVLDALLSFADTKPPFENCFPGHVALMRRVGGNQPKLPSEAANRLLGGLERAGWIRRHRLITTTGRFSSTGYQFLLPPNVISEAHPGWEGPVQFKRKRNAKLRVRV